MPLAVVHGDITKMEVDVIVNAANNQLVDGGGLNGAVRSAAGYGLTKACRELGFCKTGDAKITDGFRLPSKYLIQTVGPRWTGGNNGEEELLKSCYRKSLELALQCKCHTIAFPLISSGNYGYPKEDALRVAKNAILEWLEEYKNMTVYLILYDKSEFEGV